MPVLGHKPGRLSFASFSFSEPGAYGVFDRSGNRAVIFELLGLLPVGRQSFSLDEITAVKVRKSERFDGSGRYGLVLRRKLGGDLHFGCHCRSEAMSLMKQLTRFLALDQD